MEDTIKAIGEYHFEGFDLTGKKVFDKKVKNVVTQLYFTIIMKYLDQSVSGQADDELDLTHFATGSGTATAAKSDTALGTEVFRKAITSKTYSTTAFVCKTSLVAGESNFLIKEVGIFAKASLTLGSGTLISRANVNIDKNANLKYLVTYTLTII